jgi:hypothetical protein
MMRPTAENYLNPLIPSRLYPDPFGARGGALRPWREETRASRYGRHGRCVNSKPYLYFPASEILCALCVRSLPSKQN